MGSWRVWPFSMVEAKWKISVALSQVNKGVIRWFYESHEKLWTETFIWITSGSLWFAVLWNIKGWGDFPTISIFWNHELRLSSALSLGRQGPGYKTLIFSLSFSSSAQAQGPHQDSRARSLPSPSGPSELVWNPGASQSTAGPSQLPGGWVDSASWPCGTEPDSNLPSTGSAWTLMPGLGLIFKGLCSFSPWQTFVAYLLFFFEVFIGCWQCSRLMIGTRDTAGTKGTNTSQNVILLRGERQSANK